MADGLATISALLRERNRAGLRALRAELFLPEELPAWELLRTHYRQYGELPTPEAFQRAGIVLPGTHEQFNYFAEQLRERAVFNASRDLHVQLSDAFTSRDTTAMRRVISEANVNLGAMLARGSIQSAGRVVADVIEDYTRQHAAAGLRGITMGWEELDDITGGAQDADLTVFLARRGVGKTYAMVKMALAAWNAGNNVLFVTMEMTHEQIVRRMVSMRAGLNPDRVRRGMLSNRALARLREQANVFRDEDNPAFWILPGDFSKSTADVDNMVQEFGPDLVIIDGSYLLKPVQRTGTAKWEQQASIHEELKMHTAMGRNVPVICSVQVNRTGARLKKATDGIAAGSDEIEQLASIMVLMRKADGRLAETHRVLDVIKNRDGPSGKFVINFGFDPLNMETDSAATERLRGREEADQEAQEAQATMAADML